MCIRRAERDKNELMNNVETIFSLTSTKGYTL